MRRFKMFWKTGMPEKRIECISYNKQEDYQDFVKEKHTEGYRQIILTTTIMLKLFKKLGGLGYEVETVSIAEDNNFFSRDIELSLSNDSAFTQHFVQMLECVLPTAGMPDLLIRRVKLLKKCDGGEKVTVTLDVNGCIDVDSFTFDDMMPLIVATVQKYFFQ